PPTGFAGQGARGGAVAGAGPGGVVGAAGGLAGAGGIDARPGRRTSGATGAPGRGSAAAPRRPAPGRRAAPLTMPVAGRRGPPPAPPPRGGGGAGLPRAQEAAPPANRKARTIPVTPDEQPAADGSEDRFPRVLADFLETLRRDGAVDLPAWQARYPAFAA